MLIERKSTYVSRGRQAGCRHDAVKGRASLYLESLLLLRTAREMETRLVRLRAVDTLHVGSNFSGLQTVSLVLLAMFGLMLKR